MRSKTKAVVYVLVDVARGVALNAHAFQRREDAEACLRRIRKGRDLGEDDVQLFECIMNDGSERGSGILL
jgi:hypothetical protein